MCNTKSTLKRLLECLLIFLSVGTVYFIMECIYKQRLSHWSMFCLSGVCGLIAMLLNDKFTYEMDILLQVLICTIITTFLEYMVGITINKEYGAEFFNTILSLIASIYFFQLFSHSSSTSKSL